MGSFPRNPLVYFRNSFLKQNKNRGFRRSEVEVFNLFPTQLSPPAAAETEGKVHQEDTKSSGKRLYLQSPRLMLLVGPARFFATTWPRRPRQADEAGVPCLLRLFALSSSARGHRANQVPSPV